MRAERHIQQMMKKLKTLPPAKVAEVEDFIDFLHSRDNDRALVQAAKAITEPSLKAIWDNPDDAAYDRL
jgi:ABC-type glycerol-3-phosphate transport system substrate-binding protein